MDGAGSKNFGFRTQVIVLMIEIVAASETAIAAAWETIQTNIGAGPNTVVVAGQTYQACDFQGDASKLEQARPVGYNSKVHAKATLVFIRRRLS